MELDQEPISEEIVEDEGIDFMALVTWALGLMLIIFGQLVIALFNWRLLVGIDAVFLGFWVWSV